MNRSQRRYGRLAKNNEASNFMNDPIDKTDDIVEVLPPKERRKEVKSEKLMNNRCCYFSPEQRDQGLVTDGIVLDEQHTNIVWIQCDLVPGLADTAKHLQDLRTTLAHMTKTEERSSQYSCQEETALSVEIIDGFHWENDETSEDLDKYIGVEKGTLAPQTSRDDGVHISDIPRIKVIAEKYSRYKRNNIELRKLEEKIVCVEYDVYRDEQSKIGGPIQKMRAYFSVKPVQETDNENGVLIVPSLIKHKFHITDEDMRKLNEKEIEIIDGKLLENKPYLDELRRVLKRKRAIYTKRNKSTLDLMSLYEMAKRDSPSLDEDFSDTNLLSKAELEEIKFLITEKCDTSVHGISRRTIKSEPTELKNNGVISETIYAELIRN